MFVTFTGNPPPLGERLDGVVCGVNALFARLGNGIASRCTSGPRGPSTPCDSSSVGLPPTTRQTNRPCPGNAASNPFAVRFSSRKYSLPSRRTRILKHSRGERKVSYGLACTKEPYNHLLAAYLEKRSRIG